MGSHGKMLANLLEMPLSRRQGLKGPAPDDLANGGL